MDKNKTFGMNINDIFLILLENFSVENVTSFLSIIDLISEVTLQYSGDLEKLVFLHGDPSEIYTREERAFIENIKCVYVYPDYYKKTKKGNLPCRIIAANLSGVSNTVYTCIEFIKVVNKAMNGFNIYFLIVDNQLYFGCRLFDKNQEKDCMISKPISNLEDLSRISNLLYFVPIEDDFINYYTYLVDAFDVNETAGVDYDKSIVMKCGIQVGYIQMLNELERIYDLDFTGEKERYYHSFDDKYEINYELLVQDALEELSFIKSSRINTLEILFEAEEMIRLANKTEEDNEQFILHDNIMDKEEKYNDVSDIKTLLENPEEMIRLLKKKKGL